MENNDKFLSYSHVSLIFILKCISKMIDSHKKIDVSPKLGQRVLLTPAPSVPFFVVCHDQGTPSRGCSSKISNKIKWKFYSIYFFIPCTYNIVFLSYILQSKAFTFFKTKLILFCWTLNLLYNVASVRIEAWL